MGYAGSCTDFYYIDFGSEITQICAKIYASFAMMVISAIATLVTSILQVGQ
jgi:hypothetical protein